MPVVPRYDPQVQEQPLPNVRVSADAPAAAFGAGIGKVTEAAGDVFGGLSDLAMEEYKKANTLRVMEADSGTTTRRNDLLWDKQNGAMTKQGRNALGIRDEYSQQFDKHVADTEAGLANDAQRALYRQRALKQKEDLIGTLDRHEFQESQSYAKSIVKSQVVSAQNDATRNYGTQGKVAESIQQQTIALEAWGEMQGLPREEIDNSVREATSETHLAVVGQMLSNFDETAARKYFTENRDGMTQKDVRGADVAFHAHEIESDRNKKLKEEVLKADQKKVQNQFLDRIAQGTLGVQDVLRSNLNPTGTGSKTQFLNLIKSGNKRTQNSTFNYLFDRIHADESDPDRLVDENDLNEYVVTGQLSTKDLSYLRREMQGLNSSEEGKTQGAMERGLYKTAKAKLVQGNPLLGIKDPEGEASMVRFQKFAKEQVSATRKAGKPVAPLFDPDSKDWLGLKIPAFTRSPQDIIRSMTINSPGAIQPPKPAVPRQPSESAADYLKRIKGAK